jgi:hypothetical protein
MLLKQLEPSEQVVVAVADDDGVLALEQVLLELQ